MNRGLRTVAIFNVTLSSITLLAGVCVLGRAVWTRRTDGDDASSPTSRLRRTLVLCLLGADLLVSTATLGTGATTLARGSASRRDCSVLGWLFSTSCLWQFEFALALALSTYVALRHPLSPAKAVIEARPWYLAGGVVVLGALPASIWLPLKGYMESSTLCLPNSVRPPSGELLLFLPRLISALLIMFIYASLIHFLNRPELTTALSPETERQTFSERFRRSLSPPSQQVIILPDAPPWERMTFPSTSFGIDSMTSPAAPRTARLPPETPEDVRRILSRPRPLSSLRKVTTVEVEEPKRTSPKPELIVRIRSPDSVYLPHHRSASMASVASTQSTCSVRSDVTAVSALVMPPRKSLSVCGDDGAAARVEEVQEEEEIEDFWGMLKYTPDQETEHSPHGQLGHSNSKRKARSRPGTAGTVRSLRLVSGASTISMLSAVQEHPPLESLARCMNRKTTHFLTCFPVLYLVICALALARFVLVVSRDHPHEVSIGIMTILATLAQGIGNVIIFGVVERNTQRSYRFERDRAEAAAEGYPICEA